MKSFREFIVEKPIVTPESGVGYVSNVPKKVAKELVNRAENKKSATSKYFDATDDAIRAGAETPGKGSSGRSGSQILKDLVGEPPKRKPTSKLTGDKGRVSGSLSKGNLKFSGDAKYREMLKGMPDAPKKTPRVGSPVATTKVVKQADVSKEIAQKTADYKTERGEKAYRKTGADIEARRSFPTGKGGLKADERNPYVKREVRQARAAKLGGNVWDQPSTKPISKRSLLKGLVTGKIPQSGSIPSGFGQGTSKPAKSKPAGAPPRTALKQAITDLRASKNKLTIQSLRRKGITDITGDFAKRSGAVNIGRGMEGALRNLRAKSSGDSRAFLSRGEKTISKASTGASGYAPENKPKVGSEIVVAKKPSQPVNLGRAGKSFDPTKKVGDLVRQRRTSSSSSLATRGGSIAVSRPSKLSLPGVIDVTVKDVTPSKPPAPSPTPPSAQSVGKEVAKSINTGKSLRRAGAGGLLSALGAAQEYKVGAARAKGEGRGKLGQMFRGGARAAGAFLGGTGGSAAGGAVAGGVGAIAGGAYGYSKGAELGSKLAKKVEKTSAGKWLAKTAKKYVPGLA